MGDLAKKTLKTAQELFEEFVTKTDDWVYRGQPNDKPLRTTIERKLSAWGIVQSRGQAIEHQVRRDFVRRLLGDEHQHVSKDTLYCFALMQHHGAPTRLLDATYSPYVAARFATADGFLTDEGEPTTPVIWCLNGRWINVAAKKISTIVGDRDVDSLRNETTFRRAYMSTRPKKFVSLENPLKLNERLTIQQGVFLCPGVVRVPFEENLKAMQGWDKKENLVKLVLQLNKEEFRNLANNLSRMNLSSAALFPGLDGFARSIGEHLTRYETMAKNRTGLEPSRSRKR